MKKKILAVFNVQSRSGWLGEKAIGTRPNIFNIKSGNHPHQNWVSVLEISDPASVQTRNREHRWRGMEGVYRRPGLNYKTRVLKE